MKRRSFIFLLLFVSISSAAEDSMSGFTIPMTPKIPQRFKADTTPSLVLQAISLAAFALIPFMVMLLTPFAKLVMVFSLLRNALGVQQVPPNQVINGISLILSVFVMFPVGLETYNHVKEFMTLNPPPPGKSEYMPQYIVEVFNAAKEPMRIFLQKNTQTTHIRHFFKVAFKTAPEDFREDIHASDFIILVPAYITTQVKSGFEIGTLIFLPFFVVDVVVSNILLAMGMMMLSPVTISLPIKIFLLVMLDGWTLLTRGLIESYK